MREGLPTPFMVGVTGAEASFDGSRLRLVLPTRLVHDRRYARVTASYPDRNHRRGCVDLHVHHEGRFTKPVTGINGWQSKTAAFGACPSTRTLECRTLNLGAGTDERCLRAIREWGPVGHDRIKVRVTPEGFIVRVYARTGMRTGLNDEGFYDRPRCMDRSAAHRPLSAIRYGSETVSPIHRVDPEAGGFVREAVERAVSGPFSLEGVRLSFPYLDGEVGPATARLPNCRSQVVPTEVSRGQLLERLRAYSKKQGHEAARRVLEPFYPQGLGPSDIDPSNYPLILERITKEEETMKNVDTTTQDDLPFGLIAGEKIVSVRFTDNAGAGQYAYFAGGLELEVGDFAVVASPYGDGGAVFDEGTGGYLKVVRVESVDANPEGVRKVAKWIIAKVDVSEYAARRKRIEDLKALDAQIVLATREAKKMVELEELKKLSPELAALIEAREAITKA